MDYNNKYTDPELNEEVTEAEASDIEMSEKTPEEPENEIRFTEYRYEDHGEESIPRWNHEACESTPKKHRSGSRLVRTIIAVAAAAAIAAAAILVIVNNGSGSKTASTFNKAVPAASAMAYTSKDTATLLTLTDTSGFTDASAASEKGYVLTDVSGVVNEVLPSVVSITSRTLVDYYNNLGGSFGNFGNYGSYGSGDMNDIWDIFFGDSYGGRGGNYREIPSAGGQEDSGEDISAGEGAEEYAEEPEEVDYAMGSGTIIAQNATELLILTSYHVVEDCSSLYVTFVNDKSVDGYIKSADKEKDIAIVAVPLADIDKETLDSIKVATISTEEAKVGEGVIVIGNALGYGISVTTGIVSAVDREIVVDDRTLNVIQTDAAINSGNSGGCMLNSKGEVIGINEAKVTVSYVEGMCYAIPVLSNIELIQDLMNEEKPFEEKEAEEQLAAANSPILGIYGRDVDDSISEEYGDIPKGVYVKDTIPGSGAEKAPLLEGDIIVGVDDAVISTMEELQTQIKQHKAGDTVTLVIYRQIGDGYQSMNVDVTLTDRIS
ncbi:MAG: trypsin-like peptidase domain-containing protein [Parasporobacterium sp.]|nr:trypsin-like peptidase domain-containing protein [Parasporobacterium sp.]